MRTVRMSRTSRTAATWFRPWKPAPMRPSEVASARARCRVATPLAAPVRVPVMWVPGITERSAPVPVSK